MKILCNYPSIGNIIKMAAVWFVFSNIASPQDPNILFTLKGLVGGSTDIVEARIVSIQSHWNKNHTRVYSEVDLEVKNNLKGGLNINDMFKIFYLGGSIAGLTTIVLEIPNFEEDEQCVLFLSRIKSLEYGDHFTVTGLNHGKFEIGLDSRGEKTIRRNVSDSLQLEPGGDILPLSSSLSMPLIEFIDHVNRYID